MKKIVLCVLLAAAMFGSRNDVEAATAKGAKLNVYRLAIPGKDWALEVAALPQFSSEKQFETKESFYLQNQETEVSVMARLEKAAGDGDAATARDYYTKKKSMGGLQAEDIKQYEIGDAAVREYIIRDSRFRTSGGDVVVVKNLNYYLSHDGYWIEIQISKLNYLPSDKKLFDEILANIKIVPLEPVSL
jgi:hypothetical protein